MLGICAAATACAPEVTTQEQRALLQRYCADCHNAQDLAGGLAFERLQLDSVHADAQTWEKVIRKVSAGVMPPPGEPRPNQEAVDGFLAALVLNLDVAARADPKPGAPLLHRLNRTEYQNAIRDLLDLPIDAAALLPPDDSSEGFDNIANALSVSPALIQGYVSAAAAVSRLAIGDLTIGSSITTYRAGGVSQSKHLEGMPFGTRGGISIEHVFPLDATYEIDVRSTGVNPFSLPPVGLDEAIELVVDGTRIQVFEPGSPARVRVTVEAGPRRIDAAFVHTRQGRGVDDLNSVLASSTSVQTISITGPFDATGPGDTPSRRAVFNCTPATPADEEPCARNILARLAERAFRRPADDASMGILMEFYRDGYELRGFETGIQHALARVLVDPQFVFRFEEEPEGLAPGDVYRVDDYELASRLSFFLWSSIPDPELLDAAEAGRLSDPEALQRQVQRMLADPRASALIENFGAQWLTLRQLEAVNPASADFDGSLRRSMRRETLLLFESILRENRSIVDLLDADYTFVDERLAEHYEIPGIRGSHFRRVGSPERRRGLLGHGSILTLTSAPNRTSPVMRGQWILENILGTPVPPPPAGVETDLDETAPEGADATTVRQRLERHREDSSCAACHSLIDPVGFALENFDSTGRWRDAADKGGPIDARAQLWDGTALTGPQSLRLALLERRELFVTTATAKLMTYALGRAVEFHDMPGVRNIVKTAAQDNYRFAALVSGIVASPVFQTRQKLPASQTGSLSAAQ